jgi:integrase
MAAKIKRKLNDSDCAAMREFFSQPVTIWDTVQPGLRLIVGRHRSTFSYFRQHSKHGTRSATVKVLGHVEAGMSVKEARQAAQVEAGRIAANRITPGRRAAVKLDEAWIEYLDHLKDRADRRGKPHRWAYNAGQLYDQHISEFGKYPLADLSQSPALIRDWHKRVTRRSGPVAANRSAQLLRACYKHASKLNRNLPPHNPTSAVKWNEEKPADKGVLDFAAWFKAWEAISSPVRRAFHLCNLLGGFRPGELSRIEWRDVLVRERVILIRASKSGADVRVPMSWQIARCLRMARGPVGRPTGALSGAELVFPGARHNPVRDKLPAYGHALRHAWRTVAADEKIDELVAAFIQGHNPATISQAYVHRMVLSSWPAMRLAQQRVSTAIIKRFGTRLKIF